jgi:hypothetical protein
MSTVTAILADANIEGQVDLLIARMQSETWREFWDYLGLRHVTFADVGLDRTDTDSVVWQRCQDADLLLLTDNRNDDGPDSLETTIRSRNTPRSLPIFTIGETRRLRASTEYADQVIDRLLSYILEIDELRGTGRLFLP